MKDTKIVATTKAKASKPSLFARMSQLQRANSHRGLSPIRHASEATMAELKEYQKAVQNRISAAEFTLALISIEINDWKAMKEKAEGKLARATDTTRPALERLHKIAGISLERYEERFPQLKEIVANLNTTLARITSAISVLEADQNLRSVAGVFSISGFENLNFNMEAEAEAIRRLCYTADAFLELES